jgi:hypothetical protein
VFKKQLLTITFCAASLAVSAFAQEDYTSYKSDVTVQALGSFLKQTTQDGVKQDATNTGEVLRHIASGWIATAASRGTMPGPRTPKGTTSSASITIRTKPRRRTSFGCR